MIRYNKVCELEDFADPELAEIINDSFKHDPHVAKPDYSTHYAHRKHWEVAMSIRALRHFGALRPDSVILGVGAGMEPTSFYLTNHSRQVFATDLYLNPGVWDDYASPMMMSEPETLAPYPFHRERLIVQHMDGRILQYPDDSFDGIYSSGSIEHFGSLEFIANAAYEMGRVLKPGGTLTLSTEYKISGPANGDGFVPATYVLSPERIQRYIFEASGLEPVDDFDTSVSEATMKTERNLIAMIEASGTNANRLYADFYPHIVLENEGYRFGSAHLTLHKPNNYPVVDNAWAKPSESTKKSARALNQETTAALIRMSNPPVANTSPLTTGIQNMQPSAALVQQWDAYYERSNHNAFSHQLPKPLGALYRTILRVRYLGKAWDAQHALYHAVADNQSAVESLAEAAAKLNELQAQQAQIDERIQRIERRLAMVNAGSAHLDNEEST